MWWHRQHTYLNQHRVSFRALVTISSESRLFISRNSQNISLFLRMGFSLTLLFSGDRSSLFALTWTLRSITVEAYLARWFFFFLGFFKIRPVQRRKTSCNFRVKGILDNLQGFFQDTSLRQLTTFIPVAFIPCCENKFMD